MGTATRITLQPDARGNIPSMVRFAANIRHPEVDGNKRMEAAFREAVAALTARRGVRVDIERVGGYPRVPFAPRLLDALRRAADAAQLKHRDMPGPIPQDALHVGLVVPSVLMFIPCHGGVSHHPSESISREWCAAGLATMGPAVIETAGGLA